MSASAQEAVFNNDDGSDRFVESPFNVTEVPDTKELLAPEALAMAARLRTVADERAEHGFLQKEIFETQGGISNGAINSLFGKQQLEQVMIENVPGTTAQDWKNVIEIFNYAFYNPKNVPIEIPSVVMELPGINNAEDARLVIDIHVLVTFCIGVSGRNKSMRKKS